MHGHSRPFGLIEQPLEVSNRMSVSMRRPADHFGVRAVKSLQIMADFGSNRAIGLRFQAIGRYAVARLQRMTKEIFECGRAEITRPANPADISRACTDCGRPDRRFGRPGLWL